MKTILGLLLAVVMANAMNIYGDGKFIKTLQVGEDWWLKLDTVALREQFDLWHAPDSEPPPPPPPPPPDTSADWYVSPDGDDANPGTYALPFRTIQTGLDRASPGEAVMALAGVYNEQVTFPNSGTMGNPITLRGEVDSLGNLLAAIDVTVPVPTDWVAAPEIGDGVWKQGGFTPYLMTYNGGQLLRIYDETMQELEDVGFGLYATGKEILRWPADTLWNVHGTGYYRPFWENLTAIYGVIGDTCYLRFADGRDPSTCDLRASTTPETRAITLHNNWIVIERLNIRGATVGVKMANSDYNVIQDCDIRHGEHRILAETTSSYNIIRRNNFTRGQDAKFAFGAWGAKDSAGLANQAGYVFCKYLEGNTTSRDFGIRFLLAGEHNEVCDNTFARGNIAVWNCGGDYLDVHDNTIQHFSSIGYEVDRYAMEFRFHDNALYSCNNLFRFMSMGSAYGPADTMRSGYIYRNTLANPYQCGGGCYDLYTANSVYYPRIIFYHNSWWGGNGGINWLTDITRTPPSGLWWVNNIISSYYITYSTRMFDDTCANAHAVFDYNFCGGKYKYGDRYLVWMFRDRHNAWAADTIAGDVNYQVWPLQGGVPDWEVPDTSAAYQSGLDLSADTIWLRDTFLLGPLPGCEDADYPEYPNMGARP